MKKNRIEHKPHGKPVTRRQFLAAGLIEFAGVAMAPTLGQLLLRSTEARADASLPAFGVIDAAGGMAFPRNFMVGNQGGPDDRLNSYFALGINAAGANIGVNRSFGLPMPNSSPFLAGLLETTSAATRTGIRIGSFCHKSLDDTPSNQTSAILLVSRVLQGDFVKTGVGNRPSASGGYTGVPEAVAALRPLSLGSIDDILSAVSFRGPLGQVTPAGRQAWADAVRGLMDAQSESLTRRLLGDSFLSLAKAAGEKNQSLVTATPSLDPRQDASASAIYGLSGSTAATADAAIKATIVMNSLRNHTGPFCLYFGGYDYHNGGFDYSQSDSARDTNIGREVGRICELARLYNRPVVLQLITDGGTVFGVDGNGAYRPVGDAGDKGMTILITYFPSGPRSMARLQVGHYTNGQSADLRTVVGSDEVRVAYAVFANYLNVIGKLGDFSRYGGNILSPSELDQVLLFG